MMDDRPIALFALFAIDCLLLPTILLTNSDWYWYLIIVIFNLPPIAYICEVGKQTKPKKPEVAFSAEKVSEKREGSD